MAWTCADHDSLNRAGLDKYTFLLPQGDRHREGRKLMQGLLNPRKVPELHTLQEVKAAEFASRLARLPTEFRGHVRWCRITLRVACQSADKG